MKKKMKKIHDLSLNEIPYPLLAGKKKIPLRLYRLRSQHLLHVVVVVEYYVLSYFFNAHSGGFIMEEALETRQRY